MDTEITFAIYRTGMGNCSKEVVRTGYSSLSEAVADFKSLKGETIVHLEKDEDNEAYDALVARAHILETFAIERTDG